MNGAETCRALVRPKLDAAAWRSVGDTAKHDGRPPGHGLAQAKRCAATLGLQFAHSTNGRGVVEFDARTQQEAEVPAFPSPAAAFQRRQPARALATAQRDALLVPDFYRPALSVSAAGPGRGRAGINRPVTGGERSGH